MASNWRTRVLVKDLCKVFGLSNPELNAHVVRLSVLAASGTPIERLGYCGKTMRQQYFIRRSFATLYEFRQCFDRLDRCDEFAHVKTRMFGDPVARERWTECIDFFRTHKKIIADVRHDFGGHFGEEAARAVIKELATSSDAITGELEFTKDSDDLRAGMKLRFAEEIAAQAMHRHRGDLTEAEWREKLFTIAKQGYVHAAVAVHVIVICYLWERFR